MDKLDPKRELDISRFGDAKEFEKWIFGKDVFNMLREVQQEEVISEVKIAKREGLPKKIDAIVSGKITKGWDKDVTPLIQGRMKLGSSARFTDSESGQELSVPLIPIITTIKRELELSAPRSGRNKGTHQQYRYADEFYYMIGGQISKSPPIREDSFTVIAVVNVAPQAATLEVISWPRIMRKTFTRWKRKARRDGFDIRFRYLQGSSIPYDKLGIVPDPLRDFETKGPNKGGLKQRIARRIQYATPMIEIAPLGTFTSGKTGPYRPRNCRRTRKGRVTARCRRLMRL